MNLPIEIIINIILHSNLSIISVFSQVCKYIRRECASNYFWLLILKRDYPYVPIPFNTDYKKLYKYWYNYKSGKAKCICIAVDISTDILRDITEDKKIKIVNGYMDYLKLNIIRGDTIWFNYLEVDGINILSMCNTYLPRPYDNNEFYIYTGSKLKCITYDMTLPKEFKIIEEFPINYWRGTYEGAMNFDFSVYIDQIQKNIIYNCDETCNGKTYKIYHSRFIHWTGVEYKVIIRDRNKILTLDSMVKSSIYRSPENDTHTFEIRIAPTDK